MRTIGAQRKNIRRVLRENPSFRPGLTDVVAEAYEDAADLATLATGLNRSTFPAECPFTIDQLLDDDFLP